jgi:hypothetical protein
LTNQGTLVGVFVFVLGVRTGLITNKVNLLQNVTIFGNLTLIG